MSLLGCRTGISNTDKSTSEVLVVSLPKFLPATVPFSVNGCHSLQWVDEELWSHPHLPFGWQWQPLYGAPVPPLPLTACSLLGGSLWCSSPSEAPQVKSFCDPQALEIPQIHLSLLQPSPFTWATPASPCSLSPDFLSPCGCICCSPYLESSSCGSPHGPHLTSVSLK